MDTQFLTKTPLFAGIREEDMRHLLGCLDAREKRYEKGDVIFRAGEPVSRIGLVLEGSVNMVVTLYWGSSRIFGHMEAGDVFGENYAAVPGQLLPGDIVAAQPCRVLFLDLSRIYTVCHHGCRFHHRLIENMLQVSAQKNLRLAERMLYTSGRTIRDRLLSYLSAQASLQGSAHFRIPFNRQELADYLGVERSALSAELGKMKREGLVSFRKNEFTLNGRTRETAI
ncbi:Crp/Fnr family transcriptional regulator [Faecalibaculum rodentium]|jgi:CRP-like cAMP-binding protein|uniref:Crp/Fnr family transcriptional regulator n=1 Tax=Faecalibaculum rodentium TaxID=1702221 RepID=UPI0023F4D5C2|nr:Crp/Fnr family transcriptional regulator [Faecalibaculum rodentium]